MARLSRLLHLCLLVVLCLGAGPALADETTDAPVAELSATPAEPEPAAPSPATLPIEQFESTGSGGEDWEDRRSWRYGTQHFFGLSRGMDDAGVPRLARPLLYVVTLPFDIIHLPIAAVAGLFGA